MCDGQRHQPGSPDPARNPEGSGQFRAPWEPGRGVRSFLRQRTDARCEFYPAGKVALRDALDVLSAAADTDADNVVLPAYVPSGLTAPIREAGYTPRYHRITPMLRPALDDVRGLIDDGTLAVVTVNYFGVPQPDHDALREITDDAGVALIEDNAHAALSETPSGTLMGTRGDIGFTSLHKTLPVPDGAILYIDRSDLRATRLARAGIRATPTRGDFGYLLRVARMHLGGTARNGSSQRAGPRPDAALGDDLDLWGRSPASVYQQSKGEMSVLTSLLLDRIRPEAVVAAKRRRYRDRRQTLEGLSGVRPVYRALEPGTCPQSFPLVVESWGPLCDRVGVDRGALPRWPPLPNEVAGASRFETSQYLAEHLVPLPV